MEVHSPSLTSVLPVTSRKDRRSHHGWRLKLNRLRVTLRTVRRRQWAALAALLCVLLYMVVWPWFYIKLVHGYNYAVQDERLMSYVRLTHAASVATHHRAVLYYESQRPLINASARGYKLHRYFSGTAASITAAELSTINWYDMVLKRIKVMAAQLADGRDDAKIEKDKCIMYDFFIRNRLPIMPLLGRWDSLEHFEEDVRSGAAYTSIEQWPIFIKACHLTQGSAASTKRLKSKLWVEEHQEELIEWVRSKWVYFADDWMRPWRLENNLLTEGMESAFMLQTSAPLNFNPVRGEPDITELKMEVIWGRAYVAVCDQVTQTPSGALVTRGLDDRGAIEIFPSEWEMTMQIGTPLPEDSWYQWMLEPGYLQCAWEVAERTARIMGIDEVRVDIFLIHGKPDGCIINEDSLSSGMHYGAHFHHLAKLWAEPHVQKWYEVYDNGLKIYEQDESSRRDQLVTV